jgi:D-sedoheptulose 7-phosphate isomerase
MGLKKLEKDLLKKNKIYMKKWISSYIDEYKRVLDAISIEQVEELISRLKDSLHNDSQIFVIGNGGSAANASHFVTDLGKGSSDAVGKRFRCMSLNDNVAWMTALGNDYSYDDVFQKQITNFARPGDLLIVLSVSGNSPNVVKAITWANNNGIKTLALAGGQCGKITDIADESIIVDSKHYGHVEDAQMTICHILCYAFMENAKHFA